MTPSTTRDIGTNSCSRSAAVGPAEATQTQENGTVNEDPEAGFGSQEQEADESQLGVELTVTLLIVATVVGSPHLRA